MPRQDGNALEWASPRLLANRVVVLAAVLQDWHALKFAAPPLRADKWVVLAAVKQCVAQPNICMCPGVTLQVLFFLAHASQ